ncbi:41 kDa peptidyl-prolyl cis-trans isomerase-like protein [Elsinoe fawcettii]|nr:41 kDa peptidyl-prolyl cis-trans isomerase-like protein [Elsinoe fawcettii]
MDVQRPRAFLNVTVDAVPAGRLVVELFADKTPKTCENFLALCNGSHKDLSYALAPFHRVIDEFMIQGGDITKGNGTGGKSIYGGEFEDENLTWRDMDAAGLVCMANRGPGTNGSQYAPLFFLCLLLITSHLLSLFFITLTPCPHLNGKHTIFARLVSGQDVLTKIAEVPVDKDDRPNVPVLISRCGELERKKRPTASSVMASAPTFTSARHCSPGPRSRSRSRSRSRDDRPDDRNGRARDGADTKKRRRRSDAQADETFRGRPKTRSESRSPARRRRSEDAMSDGPEVSMESPPRKHRRVRSRSPSRSRSREGRKDRDSLRRSRSRSDSGHEGRRRRHGSRDRDGERDRRGERRQEKEMDWRDRRFNARQQGDRRGGYRDRGGRRDDRRFDDRRGYGQRRYGGDGRLNDGRLGGDEGDIPSESGIKFKGRGSMKFREPDSRRW